jgi:hypothetical protein
MGKSGISPALGLQKEQSYIWTFMVCSGVNFTLTFCIMMKTDTEQWWNDTNRDKPK